MIQWPKDTTEAKMAFYGDFRQKTWASLNLVRVFPPFVMRYDGKKINGILVHKKVAEAMRLAFVEIWEKCDRDQDKVDHAGASDYGGCFNIRQIAGSHNWSNHSWACAIDLSPGTNGFRHDDSTTLSHIVIDAFKNQGALWGGDYHGRKDPMHFEFVSR